MFVSSFVVALAAICFVIVSADSSPLNGNLLFRNAPGSSAKDTLSLIGRSLHATSWKRDSAKTFNRSITLDRSWDGVVLYSDFKEFTNGETVETSLSVDVVCTKCYIKGIAFAQFTIKDNFNFTKIFQNITAEIGDGIGNFSTAVADYVTSNIDKTVVGVLADGIDRKDFEYPPLVIDFDLDFPEVPDCELEFRFDKMELYMEINTILAGTATYIINIYTSPNPINVPTGKDLLIGVIFTVDLILSADAEIDISSGFHIELNDGISINIPIFSHNVSDMNFNGGNFEFLPVKVKSAGVILSAILRIGVRAGLSIALPEKLESFDTVGDFFGNHNFSVGIETGVFVDIAQFITNITATPDCALHVVEEYSLAIGANAGATLAIGTDRWGPEAETSTAIYYTTLASKCAKSKVATVSARQTSVAKRQDASTSVTTTTYTATKCLSTGYVHCPVSLQTISKITATKTLTGAQRSASAGTVVSAVTFGPDSYKMISLSGTPTSFIPVPTHINGTIIDQETGGVSNKIIIGVSVGVGVPLLIGILIGLLFCCRRKQSGVVVQVLQSPGPHAPGSDSSGKKSAHVRVAEY